MKVKRERERERSKMNLKNGPRVLVSIKHDSCHSESA